MTRLTHTLAIAAGLAAVSATGFAIAQNTAPQPQPAQPGMMGQMPGMPHNIQQTQQRMMPGAQAPSTTDPHHPGAAAPGTAAQGTTAVSPSTAAFMAANEKMHRDMAITYTGNADRDFAASMIPHHEGAIAMARVQLAHGRDPGMRSLAEAVIRAQEGEIATLRAFLARTPAR